jgi:hypothetical protein
VCRLYCLLHIPGPDDLSAADVGGRGVHLEPPVVKFRGHLVLWCGIGVPSHVLHTVCVVFVDGTVAF